MSVDNRPPPPSWLDKSFIQRALRAGDNDPLLSVTSCEVVMANAVGDGYASDIYRIISKLQNGQERPVVIKCHPQGGLREEVVKNIKLFDIETRMFTETLPAMYELLNDAKPGVYQPFSAKCLYYGDSPVQYIVLEDLRHSGFTLAKRQQGADLAHCLLAIKTLGRFHASSLVLHEKDPTAVESYNRAAFNEDSRQQIGPMFEKSVEHLANEVSKWPGYETYEIKLRNIQNKFFDRVIELCKRKADAFNVLLHGDPWTSNMMFKYVDGIPQDFRLVDFQTPHYSSPALDLQYFLHTCPQDEVREKHMEDLIEEYHNTFIETLDVLGSSRQMITLEELHTMLDDYTGYALMAATVVLPIVLSNPEDGFDFEQAMHMDEESDKSNKKIYSNPVYVNVMKRILPLFEEKGVFETFG